jgi:hypothetical protein
MSTNKAGALAPEVLEGEMDKSQQEPNKITNAKPIPHIPPAVEGSDSGRAHGEAANEGTRPRSEGKEI